MARLIDNEFSSYELTDEEALQGAVLSITQKQIIQNDISSYASEKLALELDMTDPHLFIQQEAKLAGQIQALSYRLTCSQTAEEEIVFRAENPESYS
jgi:hypothetical protein